MRHLYAEWSPSVYYTQTELRRIHRHFHYPNTGKLLNLIHRRVKQQATAGLRSQLAHVLGTCVICQSLARESGLFHVSIPNEDCTLNRLISLDVMKIEKKSVLHIVDRDTRFRAATFWNGKSSEAIWGTFLSCWVSAYVGLPGDVLLEQGPQFQRIEFQSLLEAEGIKKLVQV